MGTDSEKYDFDIAVTFAGEDRALVNDVVDQVKTAGYSVFYDEDEQAALWGEELTEYFPDIYERRARYAVMFISSDYAAKPWTRLERRSVLLRALNQETPYLLPVRIDQTTLPGVRETISYLDAKKLGASGIANAIQTKLGTPTTEGSRRFNGLVPRTEQEAAVLLGERPGGWEYLLFSYLLVNNFNAIHALYLDYQVGFAPTSDFVPDDEIFAVVRRENAMTQGNVRNFSTLLSENSQARAFGLPGEPGDVATITHLAQRLSSVYEDFMRSGIRLRGCATSSSEGNAVLEALSHYSDQPVRILQEFPSDCRAQLDQVTEAIARGQHLKISFALTLEISDVAKRSFAIALKKFERHMKQS